MLVRVESFFLHKKKGTEKKDKDVDTANELHIQLQDTAHKMVSFGSFSFQD